MNMVSTEKQSAVSVVPLASRTAKRTRGDVEGSLAGHEPPQSPSGTPKAAWSSPVT